MCEKNQQRKKLLDRFKAFKNAPPSGVLVDFGLMLQSFDSIGLYRALSNEYSMHGVCKSVISSGISVFFPRICRGQLKMVRNTSLDKWSLDESNILAPPDGSDETKRLDAVVVPMLGMSPDGYRLGRGGGYYDRWHTELSPICKKIGIIYDWQVVSFIPDSWDLRYDEVWLIQDGSIDIWHC